MEGQAGVWILTALLVAALIPAEAQNTPSYFEVGGDLTLTPKPVFGRITSVVWKFNGDIVGEWTEGTQHLEYSPRFKGRARVDTTTGVLEISKMTVTDIGVYTVEINNKEQDGGYDAKAIKQVPWPSVNVPQSCNKSESCVLSCDGNITGAGPVNYYWKEGDGQWKQGEQKKTITEKETSNIQKISCQIKNPLGEKYSEPVDNPFYDSSPSTGAIVGSVFGVLSGIAFIVGVGVGVVLYFKNRKCGSAPAPSTASSPTADESKAKGPLLSTNNGSSEPAAVNPS